MDCLYKYVISYTWQVFEFTVFTVFFSVSFCQVYRVTGEALIAETAVWPNFFLMNIFFALKARGTQLRRAINNVRCEGRNVMNKTQRLLLSLTHSRRFIH